MAKIDDAAILERAKKLCAQNGTTWDWTVRSNKPIIDQVDRRKYLSLAREQLLEENEGQRGEQHSAAL